MLIADMSVHLVDLAAEQPAFRWRDGIPGSRPAERGAVLSIRNADGVIGQAHTRHGVIAKDIIERVIAPEFVGADALAREYLWQRLQHLERWENFPTYLIGLVDVALWDLVGNATGLSVSQLAGGFRNHIPAYASTVTYNSISEYLDVADQCLAAGFTAIKVHAWGDLERDIALTSALREHVGDSVPLMYDGSAAFDLPDALRLGQALAAHGYHWYEEPMPESSVTAYRQLGERVDVPLLVGETNAGMHRTMGDFVAARCAPFIRTSAHLKGGITGALRIAHLAESYQLRAEVHGSGIVSRQLCMAIPNNTYYESRVSGNPIMVEECVRADGTVSVPDAPGIGYSIA